MGKMVKSKSQGVLGSGYVFRLRSPALSILFCWAISLGFCCCLVCDVRRTPEEMAQCLEALTEKPDSSQGQRTSG